MASRTKKLSFVLLITFLNYFMICTLTSETKITLKYVEKISTICRDIYQLFAVWIMIVLWTVYRNIFILS